MGDPHLDKQATLKRPAAPTDTPTPVVNGQGTEKHHPTVTCLLSGDKHVVLFLGPLPHVRPPKISLLEKKTIQPALRQKGSNLTKLKGIENPNPNPKSNERLLKLVAWRFARRPRLLRWRM